MIRALVMDAAGDELARVRAVASARGLAVETAETVCDGVRALLAGSVAWIAVDAGLLRLTPAAHATLFDWVAPGVPVTILARPDVPAPARAAFAAAGFRVVTRPEDLGRLLEAPAAVAA